MNTLNSIGSRPFQNTSLTPAPAPTEGRQTRASTLKGVNPDNAVSLSSNALDLQKRVDRLGNATVDMAQNLIGSFAKSLLGDNAEGATISFDSVALETNSSFEAGALRASGPRGSAEAFAFSLNEDSHFLGKGTITTADGRKLSFEVEIQYESRMSASAAASSVPSRRQQADENPAMPLPEVEFPDIDFPGSLADLFRLMDRQISAALQTLGSEADGEGEPGEVGNLTMRLLKLVDAESPLESYLPPSASDKARSVANAYGRQQTEPGQAAELAHAAKAARDAAAEPAPVEPPATEPTPVPTPEPTPPVAEAPLIDTPISVTPPEEPTV